MKIVFWILRVLLALYNIAGGIFLLGNYREVANIWALNTLPMPFWFVLSLIQILAGVGLVLPGKKLGLKKLTFASAVCLVVVSLLGCVLYIAYAGFPGILWGIIPALIAAYIGYKRR